jgi:hypothetical protein
MIVAILLAGSVRYGENCNSTLNYKRPKDVLKAV